MADIVVFGTGQIAEVAVFYLRRFSEHRVVALTVNREWVDQPHTMDLPVVPWEGLEAHYPPDQVSLFLPISYRGLNAIRRDRFLEGKSRGYGYISFIHPKATYFDTPVGENCFIFEDNTIQPFTEIGDNVTLWSGNHIGHHSRIGDHCFLASQVVVSGAVTIGERCFLGVNSTVADNVTIGQACLIGAGSLVLSDLADESVLKSTATDVSRVPSSRLRGF